MKRIAFILCIVMTAGGLAFGASGSEILKTAGVKGGLVVHVGCGDGETTAKLRANESYLVHGLDTNAGEIAAARTHIKGLGLYGSVSVEKYDGKKLPYTDGLVNLLVVEDASGLSRDEMMRVVAPDGVVLTRSGRRWKRVQKPRPDNIDEWTHYLHDASNNAVADDELVGPPRRMQWVSKPLWLRSHEIDSGISSVVTAKGRVFYIFDEGVIGITDERLPERWSLIARDAFNGVLLWKRPMNEWGWPQWKYDQLAGEDWTELRGQRGNIPRSLTRRLVADGDRVYVTLGYNAPLSILDAATGDVIRTVRGTEGADEILSSDGIVVVRIKDVTQDGAKRRGRPVEASFAAVDPKTGKVLWERPEASVQSLSPAIEGDRLFYYNRTNVVCLDLKTGADVWRRSSQPDKTMAKKATGRTSLGQSGTFVVSDGVVVLSGSNFIEAFDARTGDKLYRVDAPSEKGAASEDTYVIDGVIWRGISGVGYDIKTGEIAKEVSIENLHSEGHHHRCYRGKATPNYIMTAKEGIEFINIDGGENSRNNWLRGVCKYGIMPANGLLYVPSDQCFCEAGSKLLGFNAVSAAEVPKKQHLSKKANPTEKGPAYNKIVNSKSKIVNQNGWPTYRHDAARSGSTPSSVSADVRMLWERKLGERLTQAVAADGKVVIAAIDEHTVFALNSRNGADLWSFTAAGRIDSAPTIHNGTVLFGSADGWVYCLRISDGALAWRFRAAPEDRRVGAFGQLESAWPVHGTVLIQKGVAYVSAGRSSFLDGGIYVYGLDPATGKMLHKANVYGPEPDLEEGPGRCFWVEGARCEVLVGDGEKVYMRQVQFDNKLNREENTTLGIMGSQRVGLHLFSTSSLLDDEWYNRAFWSYSKQWPGFNLSNQGPKSGQIIVFDDEQTYALKAYTQRNVHTPMFFPQTTGYLLYADNNTAEPQLLGAEGTSEAVEWMPKVGFTGKMDITEVAYNKDKGVGFTRTQAPKWMEWLPIRVRAMVKAGDTLFVAGPPDVLDKKDPYAAFQGRKGALLRAVSAKNGKQLSEIKLNTPPAFDGMIAADGKLLITLEDGRVVCMGE